MDIRKNAKSVPPLPCRISPHPLSTAPAISALSALRTARNTLSASMSLVQRR